MFYEKLEFTAAQLNTGVVVSRGISVANRGVSSARVTNNTGANLDFLLMSRSEKTKYDASAIVTDLITVNDGNTETLTNISPETTVAIVKGAGSGHTSSLYIEILKDIN